MKSTNITQLPCFNFCGPSAQMVNTTTQNLHHWQSPVGTLGESACDPQKAKGWILDKLDLQGD